MPTVPPITSVLILNSAEGESYYLPEIRSKTPFMPGTSSVSHLTRINQAPRASNSIMPRTEIIRIMYNMFLTLKELTDQ